MKDTAFYLLLVIALLLSGCKKEPKKPIAEQTGIPEADLPREEGFNVKFIYSDSARTSAILTAKHSFDIDDQQARSSTKVFDQGFQLDFFDNQGELASVLSADSGEINLKEGKGIAWGNVYFRSTDGKELKTQKLFWEEKERPVWTKRPVNIWSDTADTITTATEQIIGDSMEANATFTYYKLLHIRKSRVILRD